MTIPKHELRAAEIEVYLHEQGIDILPHQRQWLEAWFKEQVPIVTLGGMPIKITRAGQR